LAHIKTQGDKILDVPLAKVGGKGLFVKEIEQALLEQRVDLAVHSMKDMPADLPEGLSIGAVPLREDPTDVLISNDHRSFENLPPGARIGTSSLRRASQLLHQRPDLNIVPLRGNLDTRLRKLTTEKLDAIILAAAGIKRLGLVDRITTTLNTTAMLPAVGQGALCIESRTADHPIEALIQPLNDPDSHTAVTAERAFLKTLEGGCQVPIAGYATINGADITVEGLVASLNGDRMIRESLTGKCEDAHQLGINLAQLIINKGGRALLDALQDITDVN
jgi:hydroxymethylbilane synthase